ncbi:hypothetical protein PVAND_007685 [Polypedilum vanderplanki]|uniref:Hydroxylysine kinase n=1 Tax=Polypedilum vanderplanki TaxID=319348 RepID=A0A9J6C7P8_POLVA|nr:hypothetical protein PVAND_007685 [Polypedilum vanderplanki]
MESIDESSILKPGTKIKPLTDENEAKIILLKVYGIKVLEICELNSYDDKNFLIFADKNIKNPYIKNFCADGYVLKILNSFDSKKIAFIEGQTSLSLYLNSQKFVSPLQLQDVEGKYYSFDNENIVRLYEFIPGKILCDVPPCANLFYHAGVYLGKLDSSLKNFNHDGYKNHKTLWMLSSVPHLQEFVHVVDESKRGMVEDIIHKFQQRVLDHLDEFPQQIIHGDFNEQNILVNKNPATGDYRVIGFIDFGDTQYSCLLFEIAVALTYMMLTTGEIETGGFFLAGYKMTRIIPEKEMNLLKLCVCARLCQSLVLGLYTYSLDKGNQYLLTTQASGWRLLEALYNRTDSEVCSIWNAVADEYLTQSYK